MLFLIIPILFSFPFDDNILMNEEIASIKYYDQRLITKQPKPRYQILGDQYPDWLGKVDGNKKINSISLPGTHETCARHGGDAVECQTLSLEEQLLNGVRVLDIRCRHINNCFMIHHDMVYQELSFGSGVRDVCIKFLQDHLTEFIYMVVKEEYNSEGNTRTFEETMQSYVNDYFYLEEGSPILDQVRGKIVLLRRFRSSITPLGNELSFKDNCIFTSVTTITARIQDYYQVATLFDRPNKWSKVNQLLSEAKSNTDENELFMNFGSGATMWCYPYSTAAYINPLIGNYLEYSQSEAYVGTIMFDFINKYYGNLIYHVIKRNYD
ncbi:1-phosphatidylinositol phosphodiesterase [Tritrichomonas foetus]|uniref:1-phosphatidylinositol phosphodiesterase n=1 Tax=Tritrichomonas foetus TaxID=1144522 RepID=A0A1J4J0B7_9EUKA|nr:1-phosphatidylinositol phosphodiesterase [Tritrichomonas foetus]|eukprot:OHS93102.1 1-phosphatidylinositol phosphodiesterase [Tritrichomonas foetus]